MPADKKEDDSLTFDDVFNAASEDEPEDEKSYELALSVEEWEVIIALAESGGEGSAADLASSVGLDEASLSNVIDSLAGRGILAPAGGKKKEEEEPEPDQEALDFLTSLRDKNHYEVLGLGPEADNSEIRKSYYSVIRTYHPDRFMKEGDPETKEAHKEIFRILTRAYDVLSDQAAKREYDLSIPEFTNAIEKEEEEVFQVLQSGGEPLDMPEENTGMAESFYESGLEDFRNGNYKEAELNFKLALSMDPDNADYKGSLEKARKLAAKEIAETEKVKAQMLEDGGDEKGAVLCLKRAAEYDPEDSDVHYDLARLSLAAGEDLAFASKHAALALDAHPGLPSCHILMAGILELSGDFADARKSYQRALSLDPSNDFAKDAVERLKDKKNEPGEGA